MIWFVFLVEMCIGVDFLLIKQIPRGRNVFCKVWVNVTILFHSGILPPNSGEDQKKGLRHILILSQSGISDFLLPSGYFLPKNWGGQTYFAPFSVKSKEALPPIPPKIDAYGGVYLEFWKPRVQLSTNVPGYLFYQQVFNSQIIMNQFVQRSNFVGLLH